VIKTSLQARRDLDWALVEITAKGLFFSNDGPKRLGGFISPIRDFRSLGTDDIAVATCTGSARTRAGTMSGHSTFVKLKYGNAFVEVRTVTFEGNLSRSIPDLNIRTGEINVD
jgi:hypothetical protein